MGSAQKLAEKQKQVDALNEIFQSNGVYLFDYRGLKVKEFQDLRNRVKALNAEVKVIKNRLAIKYFQKENRTVGRELFNGTLAVAYSNDKFVETVKTLLDFEKETKKIKVKQGFVEQKLVDEKTLAEVAKLPGREQLLAQFAFSMIAPLRKFGSALSSPLTTMLILMKNLKDKKEKGG